MQQRVQTLVMTRPEAGARALILLGAFVSFVLSVTLWFAGSRGAGHLRRALGAVDPLPGRARPAAR